MVFTRHCLLVFAILMSACSSSGFGGLSGTKPTAKKDQKAEKEDDEELTGDGDSEDKETDQADNPVEVAGAFLTIGCAPVAKKSPSSDTRTFGCAVLDSQTKAKVADARIQRLAFSFQTGEDVEPVLEEAPADGPWHVYTTLNVARVPDMKKVKAEVVVSDKTVSIGSSTFTEYDPEHLAHEMNLRPLALTPVKTHNTSVVDGDGAIDHDPGTVWSVEPQPSNRDSAWVAFQLEGPTHITRVDLDFCEATGGVFELIATEKLDSLSLHNDAVTLYEQDDGGLHGPLTIEIAQGKREKSFTYLKFHLSGANGRRVCLNGINVYGERAPPPTQ